MWFLQCGIDPLLLATYTIGDQEIKDNPAVAFTVFNVHFLTSLKQVYVPMWVPHGINAGSVAVSPLWDKCQEVNTAISQVTADMWSTMSTSVKLILSPVNIFSLAASMPLDLAWRINIDPLQQQIKIQNVSNLMVYWLMTKCSDQCIQPVYIKRHTCCLNMRRVAD